MLFKSGPALTEKYAMRYTVLIVDDSVAIREQLRSLLEECGYQVVGEAQNGLEAIDKYVRTRPHLVTLDIVMPELNGIDAAQEIFKYDPDAKVIVITSSLSQKIRLKAEELGVRSFVVKPITLDKLKMALELLKSPTKEVKYG